MDRQTDRQTERQMNRQATKEEKKAWYGDHTIIYYCSHLLFCTVCGLDLKTLITGTCTERTQKSVLLPVSAIMSKYNNTKLSNPAHPTFVNDVHSRAYNIHGRGWKSMEKVWIIMENHGNSWKRNAFPWKASFPWTNVHGQNTKMTGKLWNLSMGLMEFVHGRTI